MFSRTIMRLFLGERHRAVESIANFRFASRVWGFGLWVAEPFGQGVFA